jgi:arginine N-succinyltransferase
LSQLYKLSAFAKVGLTTFPNNKVVLKKRIHASVCLMTRKPQKVLEGAFLFVLEDLAKKRIIGVCAITPQIGMGEPSYTYKMKIAKKESKLLKINKDIQYLKLKREYNGPSEIGTLFLHPKYRHSGAGRLLSLSRFLFMAEYQRCFKSRVIAELRGVLSPDERSPFWNAVCKHFFKMTFKKADLMVMEDKTFIEELVPLHPIYIPLLPHAAQKVIGCLHKNTKPAAALLRKEGFKFINEIDIFEAGPVYGAKVKDIRTVKKSKVLKVAQIVENITAKRMYLMANVNSFKKFCVVIGNLVIKNKNVTITKEVADALVVTIGDKIRVVKTKG